LDHRILNSKRKKRDRLKRRRIYMTNSKRQRDSLRGGLRLILKATNIT
jgi:hypothetical protein